MTQNEQYAKINVLIVDDSAYSRKYLSKIVSEAGFNVVGEATSGEAAIDIAGDRKIDIAIIDVVMPEVSGIELTEVLMKSLRKLKIISISSIGHESVVLKTIAAGAADFMLKPIKDSDLISSLKRLTEEIKNG